MNTFTLSLDLDKEQGLPQLVTLRQGDKSGTQLVATIYDHGQLVSGGYTARVSLRHPGSGDTYYRETATYSNGVATVTVDEQYAATVPGVTTGYFELLQGSSVKASTADFIVRILPSAEDGAVPGEVYDSAIEDALAELDAATGRISQMVVDATSEYLAAHPEITTTVQDNSVTDAKLIQSGGVLDRVGRLWWRLENLLTNTPAESESVTVSDAAKTPVAGLTVFGKSTQDGTPTPSAPVAIQSVTPNLLPNEMLTRTVSGVTFTHQEDGSIRAVGNSTAQILIRIAAITLPAGTYTVGPAPTGASSTTYFFNIDPKFDADGVNQNIYADPYTATATVEKTYALNIYVRSGQAIDTTFYPCIFAGSNAPAYVPHNNVGLWARGRNLFDSIRTGSRTNNGITWTYNADGTITANGTASSSSWSHDANTRIPMELAAGTYTASVPSPLGLVVLNSTDGGYIYNGSDSTKTFTLTKATTVNVYAMVASGATVTNLTFGIQLEIGSTATPYQPYADSVTALPTDGHTLRSLPDGTRDEVTVDQYGHVTLIQRVGAYTFDGSETFSKAAWGVYTTAPNDVANPVAQGLSGMSGWFQIAHPSSSSQFADGYFTFCNLSIANYKRIYFMDSTIASADAFKAALAASPMTLLYPLATPVTHDLGTIDPTALVGPDMTAQAVPTAPFALTYERDLNATLTRLEAALATLA